MKNLPELSSYLLTAVRTQWPELDVFILIEKDATVEKCETECLKKLQLESSSSPNYLKWQIERPSKGQAFGVFAVHIPENSGNTKEEFHQILDAVLSNAELSIENILFMEESLNQAIVEREMQNAKAVQEALLPSEIPVIPDYDLSYFFESAVNVGGAWVGFFHNEETKTLRLYIGDVTGHGVSSALVTAAAMGTVKTIDYIFKSNLEFGSNERILNVLNHIIGHVGVGHLMMTFCVVELNLETGKGMLYNAGHNAPFVVSQLDDDAIESVRHRRETRPTTALSRDLVRSIQGLGNRLGYANNIEVGSREFCLEEGETLLLYTDGLIEAVNPKSEEYGICRLKSLAAISSKETAAHLVDHCINDLTAFCDGVPRADDTTILVLKRLPKNAKSDAKEKCAV